MSASSFCSDATLVASSLPPTISAPADSASVKASPPANTAIRTSLPVPFGNETVVLIFCSASFVSMPKENATSTDSSKFAGALFLHKLIASDIDCFSDGIDSLAILYFFPIFFIFPPLVQTTFCLPKISFLVFYSYSHRPCSSSNYRYSCINIISI